MSTNMGKELLNTVKVDITTGAHPYTPYRHNSGVQIAFLVGVAGTTVLAP